MTARFETLALLTHNLTEHWKRQDCIFRGQCEEFALIPKIGRPHEGRSILGQEAEIIERFKELYRTMYERGADHSDFRIHPDSLYEWDWLALAQHYGLPTRLLDWSADVEVALYFAVEDRRYDGCDGTLDIFQDPTAISRQAPLNGIVNVRRYRAYRHSHFTDLRVKRQKGELTLQPDPTTDLFEQLGHDGRQKWERIIVPKERKPEIRSLLRQRGITRSSLFPGFAGVCREIELELEL